MADDGNRGPNDIRARNGKKRREPPIIDASATEVPLAADAPASTDPAEPRASEVDSPGTGKAEADEPVLFGSALREPGDRSEVSADAAAAPADAAGIAAPADTAAPAASGPAVADAPAPLPSSVPAHPSRAAFDGGNATLPPDRDAAPVTPAARSGGAGAAPWLLTLSTLALLGALAWVLYTEPQRDGHAEIADLRGKIAALEARPDPAQLQNSLAAVDKRIGAADAERATLGKAVAGLTARVDAAAQDAQSAKAEAGRAAADAGRPAPAPLPTGAAAAATVGALAALAVKVEGVDRSLSSLSADQARTAKAVAEIPKPVAPDFGPVNARVAGVETQLSGKVAALDAQVTGLDGKLNGSDARFNGFDAKVNAVDGKVNGFDARVNGVEARANAAETKLNDASNALGKLQAAVTGLPKVDLSPLQAASTGLGKRLDGVEAQLSASKDGARVTEARAVGTADDTRATPIALVAQVVQRAIADGRPYAADLDALKALGAEPDAIARLQPAAARGVPSTAALKERWERIAPDALATARPGTGGSALDRFAAGARSLVQVRQAGAPAGDDAGPIAAQVGAALDAGDVAGALTAWGRLPQAAQDRSKDWAAAARTRVDAAQAAQVLVDRAIATLGKTRS